MGSFDKVRQLLNEVTYNPEKSVAKDKKRFDDYQEKLKGKSFGIGFEEPAKTEKKRSQLLKVGSKAHAKAKRARAHTDKFMKFRKSQKAPKYMGDSTEILAILQSLKESFEKGLITEEAFLELAKPIVDSINEGSLGLRRLHRVSKMKDKAFNKAERSNFKNKEDFSKAEKAVDLSLGKWNNRVAKDKHRNFSRLKSKYREQK